MTKKQTHFIIQMRQISLFKKNILEKKTVRKKPISFLVRFYYVLLYIQINLHQQTHFLLQKLKFHL